MIHFLICNNYNSSASDPEISVRRKLDFLKAFWVQGKNSELRVSLNNFSIMSYFDYICIYNISKSLNLWSLARLEETGSVCVV